MTHTVPEPAARDPLVTGAGVELRWTAQRLDGHETLVVTLEPVDTEHALLEAWVEGPRGVRPTVARQPVSCTSGVHGGFLHADAHLDGRRVLAVSVPTEPKPATPDGLRPIMFAQSTLLAAAGFPPGGCDPPTARLRTKMDAVSA
ncbi:MAG: hypothetical protein ACYTGP_01690 [Planctomycetota bacterium]|jgi:hypothetical protein